MNNITNEIVQEAIMTEIPDIVGLSTALDAEDEENIVGMNVLITNLLVHIQFTL